MKCVLIVGFLFLISSSNGKPYENRRFRRQTSAFASSSSSSGSNPTPFGIGAAAGIGGLGVQSGIGSFNADTRSSSFLPFGAFAGLNLPNAGRIGAGCTGLTCGFQLGDYVAQFPFFRNSQGSSFLGTRINKLNSNTPETIRNNNATNENVEASAPAEIIETKLATPSSPSVSTIVATAQIPSPNPTASDRTLLEMTSEVQRNTANLMRTAQDFLSNLLGGLRDFSSNLAGLFQGNSTGIRAGVTFPFAVSRSSPGRTEFIITTSTTPSPNDEESKKKIIHDSDAFNNLVVLFENFDYGNGYSPSGPGSFFQNAHTQFQQNLGDLARFGSSGGSSNFASTSSDVNGLRTSSGVSVGPEGKVTSFQSGPGKDDTIKTRIATPGQVNGVYSSSSLNVDQNGKVTGHRESGHF